MSKLTSILLRIKPVKENRVNKLFYTFLIWIIMYGMLCFMTSCNQDKQTTELTLNYKEFQDPGNEFRSYPFYSLNDSLSPTEIAKQVAGFKNAGFGGFYLHSRAGLTTPYLGKGWWNAIDAAVKQAQASGLNACFYDEDKWPSGYAGGIIPQMNEDFRAKCLVKLDSDTPLPQGAEILKQDDQYKYICYTVPMGNPIFNGTSWVDLFNPEMVKAFIETSYQPYVEKYNNEAGMPGFNIFSDEPHIHARYFDKDTPNYGTLSYSPYVRSKFKTLFGYDFLDKVDLLFEEKENWRQVRLQYYQAVALQFEESFTKQIATYCKSNGVSFTGHFLGEDVLKKVRDRIGNSMLHYRNMQQPGIDHLGLSIQNKLMTAKSLSSVANQYDIPNRISELYGISGQNMNFEDRKWIAGWHTILGINRFCPHLTAYSLKGARKRDYPPTFSYHQPYWEYNKLIEDYTARLAYVTSVGTYQPQVLVIRPLESEFIKGSQDKEFTKDLLTVLEELQKAHFDYDLGDEQIIQDTAYVSSNQFVVGQMSYSSIILPDMISIRSSTLLLIQQFINNGGKVFYTGRFPEYIDGLENQTSAYALKAQCIALDKTTLKENLILSVQPAVIVGGKNGEQVWSQVRKTDEGNIIQLFNTSHIQSANITISSSLLKNNPVLWDPGTAQCYTLKSDSAEVFNIHLSPSSSVWISTNGLSEAAELIADYKLPVQQDTLMQLSSTWHGKRLAPNAITLDYATYSIDGGLTFSQREPVIGIMQRLNNAQYKGALILNYNVDINDIPDSCALVLENPGTFEEIAVNDNEISFNTNTYYLDHNFPTANIQKLLTKGTNNIKCVLQFEPENLKHPIADKRYGTEIESIYLIGNFAVKGDIVTTQWETQRNQTGDFIHRPAYGFSNFSIGKESNSFNQNLTLEGYPFYKGSFLLSQSFNMDIIAPNKQYYINLNNYEAIVCEVKINKMTYDPLCWSPYQLNITDALVKGENTIEIKFTNSLRNLLGPHHQQKGELTRVGPTSFTGAGGFPDSRGDSDWYERRLTNAPLKIWTDTFYCIPFGFLSPASISTDEKPPSK